MACYKEFGVLYDGMGILGSCGSCFASFFIVYVYVGVCSNFSYCDVVREYSYSC